MKTPFVLHRVLVAGLLLGPAVSPAATGFSGGIAWSYLIVVRYSDAEGSKQIARIEAPDPGAPKSAISNSTIGDISIPGYLGGCPVTDIGWNAFYGCSGYPNCDFVAFDEPTGELCPKCKSPLVKIKDVVKCSNRNCH